MSNSPCLICENELQNGFSHSFQLIEKAREYLGLSDLEKHNEGGGVLEVHIGDVFSPSVTIPGGYAGISLP